MKLPLYQCHKKVRAAKIVMIDPHVEVIILTLDNGEQVTVSRDWFIRNPKLEIGGYFVEYQEGDGYTAYSPAAPFESGYTLIEPADPLAPLVAAADPLITYLRENHHPHVKAIVDNESVELMEGLGRSVR